MRFVSFLATTVLSILLATSAQAGIDIRVDKSTQRMTVSVDGQTRHHWAISSGRMGYDTPRGTYRPQRLHRHWASRKYHMAPMPYSIFFHGGYAIHGTSATGRLGRTDSHGCIRLHPSHAAQLFELVKTRTAATRIIIEGEARHAKPAMVAKARPQAPRPYRQARVRPMVRDGYYYVQQPVYGYGYRMVPQSQGVYYIYR